MMGTADGSPLYRLRAAGRTKPARSSAQVAHTSKYWITRFRRTGFGRCPRLGIVHRDLKRGEPVFTKDLPVEDPDFGLAKLTRPEGVGSSAQARIGPVHTPRLPGR